MSGDIELLFQLNKELRQQKRVVAGAEANLREAQQRLIKAQQEQIDMLLARVKQLEIESRPSVSVIDGQRGNG